MAALSTTTVDSLGVLCETYIQSAGTTSRYD
jgi:hypothetical protein